MLLCSGRAFVEYIRKVDLATFLELKGTLVTLDFCTNHFDHNNFLGIYGGFLKFYKNEASKDPLCWRMEHFIAMCMYNNLAVFVSLIDRKNSPDLKKYFEKTTQIINGPFQIISGGEESHAPGQYKRAILTNLSLWEQLYGLNFQRQRSKIP